MEGQPIKAKIDLTQHYVPVMVLVSAVLTTGVILFSLWGMFGGIRSDMNDMKVDMIDRINMVANDVSLLKGAIKGQDLTLK
jgi:hypothetical protein